MASVSAVIVHHESPSTLVQVLDALAVQQPALEHIVIVDNGSRIPLQEIQQTFPRVEWVILPENTGLPRARNIGLAHVKSDLVLVLDDDVYLAPGSLERLVEAISQSAAALVCPRIVLHPDDTTIQCDGASIHFTGMLSLNHRDAPVRAVPAGREECGAFIGACVLARRQLLADLGGFDEDYFFYHEDLELSYRLRALGHSIWCEGAAVARHDRGAGTPGLSFRGTGRYPAQRAYFNLRHRWMTILLHYQLRTLVVLSPALLLYETAAFIECIRRGWVIEWVRAWLSCASRLPDILIRRKSWQRRRSVPDDSILVGGPLPFATGFAAAGFAARASSLLSTLLDDCWKRLRPWL